MRLSNHQKFYMMVVVNRYPVNVPGVVQKYGPRIVGAFDAGVYSSHLQKKLWVGILRTSAWIWATTLQHRLFWSRAPHHRATDHQNSKLNIVLYAPKSTLLLLMPWWCRRLFSASRSPIVANEGVLESPRPPGSLAIIAGMSRGRELTSWGRFPRRLAYHGNMICMPPWKAASRQGFYLKLDRGKT